MMEWIHVFGLFCMVIMMIPNIIFALKCKDGFVNQYHNRFIEMIEQIGRFGCFIFMIIEIPGTSFGWLFDGASFIYMIIDMILLIAYCMIWMICFKKESLFRSLALSMIPSAIFLLSGILRQNILLIISSILFAPSHMMISYKNAI